MENQNCMATILKDLKTVRVIDKTTGQHSLHPARIHESPDIPEGTPVVEMPSGGYGLDTVDIGVVPTEENYAHNVNWGRKWMRENNTKVWNVTNQAHDVLLLNDNPEHIKLFVETRFGNTARIHNFTLFQWTAPQGEGNNPKFFSARLDLDPNNPARSMKIIKKMARTGQARMFHGEYGGIGPDRETGKLKIARTKFRFYAKVEYWHKDSIELKVQGEPRFDETEILPHQGPKERKVHLGMTWQEYLTMNPEKAAYAIALEEERRKDDTTIYPRIDDIMFQDLKDAAKRNLKVLGLTIPFLGYAKSTIVWGLKKTYQAAKFTWLATWTVAKRAGEALTGIAILLTIVATASEIAGVEASKALRLVAEMIKKAADYIGNL